MMVRMVKNPIPSHQAKYSTSVPWVMYRDRQPIQKALYKMKMVPLMTHLTYRLCRDNCFIG